MVGTDGIIGPVAGLLDRIVQDPVQRDAVKLALVSATNAQAIEEAATRIVAGAPPADAWTRRARPTFLYVMYALLLWSIPMGLIAAVRPALGAAIAHGMNAYLAGIPEPLYALFGTGYLGYTVARQWGKATGTDR